MAADWRLGDRATRLLRFAGVALAVVMLVPIATGNWPGTLAGSDGMRYWWGARDFLAGVSPWDRFYDSGSYAGSPTAILAFIPFALLPAWAFLALWVPVVVASAVFIIRRLRMGWWWFMYPPLVDGMFKLQPTIVVVALILAGAGGLAAAIKVIALPPMMGEFRWRALTSFVAVSAISVLVAPELWVEYVRRFGELSGRLVGELGGGPNLLTIPAAIACFALGSRRAGWLMIPVAWPGWEYHYGLLLLPVAGPIALAGALPWREAVQVAVIAAALWQLGPPVVTWANRRARA